MFSKKNRQSTVSPLAAPPLPPASTQRPPQHQHQGNQGMRQDRRASMPPPPPPHGPPYPQAQGQGQGQGQGIQGGQGLQPPQPPYSNTLDRVKSGEGSVKEKRRSGFFGLGRRDKDKDKDKGKGQVEESRPRPASFSVDRPLQPQLQPQARPLSQSQGPGSNPRAGLPTSASQPQIYVQPQTDLALGRQQQQQQGFQQQQPQQQFQQQQQQQDPQRTPIPTRPFAQNLGPTPPPGEGGRPVPPQQQQRQMSGGAPRSQSMDFRGQQTQSQEQEEQAQGYGGFGNGNGNGNGNGQVQATQPEQQQAQRIIPRSVSGPMPASAQGTTPSNGGGSPRRNSFQPVSGTGTGSPAGSPSRQGSTTQGGGGKSPLERQMAQFERIVELIAAQPQKTYVTSPPELEMILARTSAGGQPKQGQPGSASNDWDAVWLQLSGISLSMWSMKETRAAAAKGEKVPPTYFNITDSSLELLAALPPPPHRPNSHPHHYVFSLNTAGSNRLLFSCPTERDLARWTMGLRLAAWERARLEEIYTGHLIQAGGREPPAEIGGKGGRGRMEGWVRVRVMGGTEWRRLWAVLSTPVEDSGKEDEKKHRRRSFFGIGGGGGGGGGGKEESAEVQEPNTGVTMASFYVEQRTAKNKTSVVPVLTITDVSQAYAVFPERLDVMAQSNLFKVVGRVSGEMVTIEGRLRDSGWALLMPEPTDGPGGGAAAAGSVSSHHTLGLGHGHAPEGKTPTPLSNMMRWVTGFHDAFGLYGRPGKYIWDQRDQRSLFFAYPHGNDRFNLFLDTEEALRADFRVVGLATVRSQFIGLVHRRLAAGPAAGQGLMGERIEELSGEDAETASERGESREGSVEPENYRLPPLPFGAPGASSGAGAGAGGVGAVLGGRQDQSGPRSLTPITERTDIASRANSTATARSQFTAVGMGAAPGSGSGGRGSSGGSDDRKASGASSKHGSQSSKVDDGRGGVGGGVGGAGGEGFGPLTEEPSEAWSSSHGDSSASASNSNTTVTPVARGTPVQPGTGSGPGSGEGQATGGVTGVVGAVAGAVAGAAGVLAGVVTGRSPQDPPTSAESKTGSSVWSQDTGTTPAGGTPYQSARPSPLATQHSPGTVAALGSAPGTGSTARGPAQGSMGSPLAAPINFSDQQQRSPPPPPPQVLSPTPRKVSSGDPMQAGAGELRDEPAAMYLMNMVEEPQPREAAKSASPARLVIDTDLDGMSGGAGAGAGAGKDGHGNAVNGHGAKGKDGLGRKPSGARALPPRKGSAGPRLETIGGEESEPVSEGENPADKVERLAPEGAGGTHAKDPSTGSHNSQSDLGEEFHAYMQYADQPITPVKPKAEPAAAPARAMPLVVLKAQPQPLVEEETRSSFAPSKAAEERRLRAEEEARQQRVMPGAGRRGVSGQRNPMDHGDSESEESESESEEEEEEGSPVTEKKVHALPVPPVGGGVSGGNTARSPVAGEREMPQRRESMPRALPPVPRAPPPEVRVPNGNGEHPQQPHQQQQRESQFDPHAQGQGLRGSQYDPSFRQSGYSQYDRGRTISQSRTPSPSLLAGGGGGASRPVSTFSYNPNAPGSYPVPGPRRSPVNQAPPAARQTVWNANFSADHGMQENKSGKFVELEEPEQLTKAFAPHGLLQAGIQDKEDRSAKKQEEAAREMGSSLINVPAKPPPPEVGLLGAVATHERERKNAGGIGATLTDREREKRLAEERQREIERLQRQQMEMGGQYGGVYPQQQGYGYGMGMPPMGMNMGMMGMPQMGMGYPQFQGGYNPYAQQQAMMAAQMAYQQTMMAMSQAGSQAGDVPDRVNSSMSQNRQRRPSHSGASADNRTASPVGSVGSHHSPAPGMPSAPSFYGYPQQGMGMPSPMGSPMGMGMPMQMGMPWMMPPGGGMWSPNGQGSPMGSGKFDFLQPGMGGQGQGASDSGSVRGSVRGRGGAGEEERYAS